MDLVSKILVSFRDVGLLGKADPANFALDVTECCDWFLYEEIASLHRTSCFI